VSDGPTGEPDNHATSRRANVAAVIAVVVLAAIGYWAFTAIDHARKLQNCLDEGRHNCAERVDQGK
jgi:hypothetical protein